MWALPPDFRRSRVAQITGLACPECHGVLEVHVEEASSGYVMFACRIGHSYSLIELLMAKENSIEHALRATERAFEEMIQLLKDLRDDGGEPSVFDGELQTRVARARHHVEVVRAVTEQNQPLDLGVRDASVSDAGTL